MTAGPVLASVLGAVLAEWHSTGYYRGDVPMTTPDHGPMTDDLDAMTYDELQRALRLVILAADRMTLVVAIAAELEHRDLTRERMIAGCAHPADHRCLDCATDAEVLASLPPFPGGSL